MNRRGNLLGGGGIALELQTRGIDPAFIRMS